MFSVAVKRHWKLAFKSVRNAFKITFKEIRNIVKIYAKRSKNSNDHRAKTRLSITLDKDTEV